MDPTLTERQVVYIAAGVLTEWLTERGDSPSPDATLKCPQLPALLRGTQSWRGRHPLKSIESLGKPLQDENTIQFVVEKVSEWISIVRANRHRGPFLADPSHSCLLRRLLSGKKALPLPPPKLNSEPCYDLAEGKPVQVTIQQHNDSAEESKIVIGQCWDFEWENRDEGILRHAPSGDRYQLDGQILQKVSA